VVKIVPGLEAGAAAVLRMPKGARYSPLAGPVTNDTDVNVRDAGVDTFRSWATGMHACVTLQHLARA
jgi:hypothetical protein